MELERAGKRCCPDTGLAVPECSCRRCLETMLAEFSPELLVGEIRITRTDPPKRPDPGERREAA